VDHDIRLELADRPLHAADVGNVHLRQIAMNSSCCWK